MTLAWGHGEAVDPPHKVAWISYLKANKGQGDTFLLEVLQELTESHNHGVVYIADMRALQDSRTWWGCWGDRPRVCSGEKCPSGDHPQGCHLTTGPGWKVWVSGETYFPFRFERPFPRQRNRSKHGPYFQAVGESQDHCPVGAVLLQRTLRTEA